MFLNIHITSNSRIDPEIGEYIEIKITEHIQYCILMLPRKAKLSGNWVVKKCWSLEIGYAHLIPFPNKALSHILNKVSRKITHLMEVWFASKHVIMFYRNELSSFSRIHNKMYTKVTEIMLKFRIFESMVRWPMFQIKLKY